MILSSHGIIGSSIGQFDPDAAAFFQRVADATGTLSATEKTAVNTLVVKMKFDGIWNSMKAIYPMVGASAAACAQNLKSSSFTGTFTSGWTFTSTGVTPNGNSAFMNTGLNANTVLTLNNVHTSFYSRTNSSSSSIYHTDIGCSDSPTDATDANYVSLYLRRLVQANMCAFDCNRYTAGISANFINANSQCMIIGSRTSPTLSRIYRNGTLQNSATSTNLSVNPNLDIYIGANNKLNTAVNFSILQCAFASIGDGLTDTQASNFYTAVQNFNTTLNRQIAP